MPWSHAPLNCTSQGENKQDFHTTTTQEIMGVDSENSSDLCSGRRPLPKFDEFTESTRINWRYTAHSHLKNIKNRFHSGTCFCLTLVEHDSQPYVKRECIFVYLRGVSMLEDTHF